MKDSLKHIFEASAGASMFWFVVMVGLSLHDGELFQKIAHFGLIMSGLVFVESILIIVLLNCFYGIVHHTSDHASDKLKQNR